MPSLRIPGPLAALLFALALALTACAAPAAPPLPPTHTPFPDVAVPTATLAAATPTSSPPAPVPQPSPSAAPGIEARLAAIGEAVSKERGLGLPQLPKPKFLSRAELEQRFKEHAEDVSDQDDIVIVQDLLEVMGVIEKGTDLRKAYDDLHSSNILGFFDTESGELVVVGSEQTFGGIEEMTYAHEYTHALQQAAFDIGNMARERRGDSEASAGLTALAEGDATLAMYNYILKRYTRQQVAAFDGGDGSAFARVPRFIAEGIAFPYREGLAFVSDLYARGGWAAVDRAYANPPVSTQQVLHPELYRAGKAPVKVPLPDFAATLGAGWSLRRQDTFGEFDLRSILLGHLPFAEAAQGASGWAGDSVALLRGPDGRRLVVSVIAWDSEREAFGFFEAYGKWLRTKGLRPEHFGTHMTWDAPGQAATIRAAGQQTLLVIAPDAPTLERVRALFPAFG